MIHRNYLTIAGTALVGALLWAPSALADGLDGRLSKGKTATPAAMLGGKALGTAALASYRGGADLHLNDIHGDGQVRENRASNLATGSNFVTDGALAGADGFSTVVQNSGNNVLIQNATIINMQVQ